MEALGLPYLDLVCFNLYPLGAEIANPKATPESVIEKTDIGGPTALNSGAKGQRIVIGDPNDYQKVIDWLKEGSPNKDEFVKALTAKAYFITSSYYLPAAKYHSGGLYDGIFGERVEPLKYGENPYMTPAALYKSNDDPLAVHNFQLLEGDERSLVGLTDVDRLLQVLTHIAAGFDANFEKVPFIAVGVKHGNACGAAVGDDPIEVIMKMVAGDKRAIFGGVIMTNFEITREVAEALMAKEENDPPRLFDGVFASSFTEDASEVLRRRQGKCRMMFNPALADLGITSLDTAPRIRQLRGGFTEQPNYTFVLKLDESDSYGDTPSEQEQFDLILAWAIGCVSNSNTITIVRDGQLLGNGVGQQDRVGAAELAIKRAKDAGHDLRDSVAWSDSFFPAPDGPEVLALAGIGAIFTSSGSRRDSETIAMCETHKVTLLMQPDTKVRGFSNH